MHMSARQAHDPRGSIAWVFASEAEAKPFVEALKATKRQAQPYNLYVSPTTLQAIQHVLIVSGIGSLKAALATAWLAGYLQHRAVWVNVGVGGHAQQAVGTVCLAYSVQGPLLSKIFYPSLVVKNSWLRLALETLEHPSDHYCERVFDMEASGFVSAAQQFSSKEFVQVIKVISDNEGQPLVQFDKAQCYALLKPQVLTILAYANSLITLQEKTLANSSPSYPMAFRTTHSQQRIVDELLYKIKLAGLWAPEFEHKLRGQRSVTAAIEWLRALVDTLVPKF